MAIENNEGYIASNGFRIPYKIITERRRSARAAIGQRGLSIRVPKLVRRKWKEQKINEFLQWVENLALKNPVSFIRFYTFEFRNDDIITIYNKVFSIKSSFGNSAKIKILQEGNSIIIPEIALDKSYSRSILRTISNLLKTYYLPIITDKVQEINQRSLKVDYSSVHMNYTSSKWGSCDSKGRIWLSTRLISTPAEIQEYIIIHELAHRIEANHSQRFWNLVAKYCPNYKTHMQWLKVNGPLCDFYPDRVKQKLQSMSK